MQGHRGARGLWPENTLLGFAKAIELGVGVLELDVGLTRDGVPVLHHDQVVNGRPIRELCLAEIRLTTLAEVCEIAAGVVLAVEIKTDPSWRTADVETITAAAAEVCESHGTIYRLLGFDWRVLAAARKFAPDVPRVALVEEATLDVSWLGCSGDVVAAARRAGADMFSPRHSMTDAALVERAHAAGLPVVVWTVNDPVEARRFEALGVDAIVTDFPDRFL